MDRQEWLYENLTRCLAAYWLRTWRGYILADWRAVQDVQRDNAWTRTRA